MFFFESTDDETENEIIFICYKWKKNTKIQLILINIVRSNLMISLKNLTPTKQQTQIIFHILPNFSIKKGNKYRLLDSFLKRLTDTEHRNFIEKSRFTKNTSMDHL